MKYTKLGKSDLIVSRICMGCMGFGEAEKGMHKWTLPYEESKAIIVYGLEKGINFFDTAMAYQGGTGEEFLGRAIRELVPRDRVVLATKYTPRSAETAGEVSGAEWIQQCVDNSLRRLGTDYIDLYIMHSWDYLTPVEETLQALNDVIRAGKVRDIGVSNCSAWQLAQANAVAQQNGWAPFVSIQGHYNLLAREEEREMAPFCYANGIAMTPYSALAAGRLSKRPGETSQRLELDTFAKGKYDATAEADSAIIARVAALADRRGVSMTEISLAWLLTKVASPVVGATKPHHVDGAVQATDLELTSEEIAELEAPYIPHALVGVIAQNRHLLKEHQHVWPVESAEIAG